MSLLSAREPWNVVLIGNVVQEVKDQHDPELLVLETDNVLFKDDGFRCLSSSSSF